MRIWVTRTAPENRATAARLEHLGHEAVCVPVLDVRAIEAEPLVAAPHAIVFTSANGVRHHPVDAQMLGVPVFAVGDRTAAEAATAGYVDVRSADGDVFALHRLIRDQLPPPSRLVHFGGREVAGDLRMMLRRFGYLVDRRVVYAAHAVAIRWLLKVRNELPSIDGIVVHSPRAAERVARVLAGTKWKGTVWCISEACARKLAGVPRVRTRHAARPTEAALMELVRSSRVVRLPTRTFLRAVPAAPSAPPLSDLKRPANDNEAHPDGGGDGWGPADDPPPAA